MLEENWITGEPAEDAKAAIIALRALNLASIYKKEENK